MKNLKNLGKILSKTEQQSINGGLMNLSHYTVTCTSEGGGDVNSISEANDLIRQCWAAGGRATIRSND